MVHCIHEQVNIRFRTVELVNLSIFFLLFWSGRILVFPGTGQGGQTKPS